MAMQVTIVGGGMITYDQILPAIYHMQRDGIVGDISICALNSAPLKELVDSDMFTNAFPGQSFTAYPDVDTDPNEIFPDLYKEVIAKMPPKQMVVVAVPDQFHYACIMTALEADQHVLTVKPLVLKYEDSVTIEKLAREKGLFVGVEYHKRFDRRALEARGQYQGGHVGEFKCGDSKLIEPYLYRYSNFQNWFTKENTDPFAYIGCHYVDLVHFITGLKPTEVSVLGVEGTFPNGNVGFMWSNARVVFENGAALAVLNGLGYPDKGAGTNDQGLTMYCEGNDKGGIIKHNDQFRGVSYGYVDVDDCEPAFRFINPDYMRLVPHAGEGLKPVGYGYDSIEANILSAMNINNATEDMSDADALAKRQELLEAIDKKGLIATPKNSYINELVMEAGRLSILNDGQQVEITYGENPGIKLK